MTSESNALMTVSAEDIAAYYAESAKPKHTGIPRLKINARAEDDSGTIILDTEGKPLGGGSFFVDGINAYQKEVKFIPMIKCYQYTKLTEDFKLDSATIYFKDWNTEPLDSKGGVRCGRPDAKSLRKLGEVAQEEYKKQVPCSLHLFGLVFFDGGPGEGIPVDLRVSGGKFAAVSEALENTPQWNGRYFTLGTKRATNGGTVFYELIIRPTRDMITPTPFVIARLHDFNAYIKGYNESVIEKHQAAVNEGYSNAQAEGVMSNIIDVSNYVVGEEEDNTMAG